MDISEDLITQVLQWVANVPPGRNPSINVMDFPDYTQDELDYHMLMCWQQGWVEGDSVALTQRQFRSISVTGLTMAGSKELRSRK